MVLRKVKLFDDIECLVPENKNENISPTFVVPDQLDEALNYYLENGYVVVSGCFTKKSCEMFSEAWENKIKKYRGYLLRQSSNFPQKNIFNKKGWIMNSLQNIHNLSIKNLPDLRNLFDLYILDNLNLINTINLLLSTKRSRVVQSMYFEGNTKTQPHQDSYYLDDEDIGRMAACWIAIEDIDWNAGRFYVCPGSHKYDKSEITRSNNLFNEKNFVQQTLDFIKEKNLEIRAPFLQKGDVLIWNSLTIHGSLPDVNPNNSRSSITVHFTTANSKFRLYRNKLVNLKVEKLRLVDVYRSFDYDKFSSKLKIFLIVTFPKFTFFFKRLFIKLRYIKKK